MNVDHSWKDFKENLEKSKGFVYYANRNAKVLLIKKFHIGRNKRIAKSLTCMKDSFFRQSESNDWIR